MASVLVVDDEFGITDALDAVLTDEGYEVSVVHNGKEALEQIARHRPDLILLDFMMPVMDGGELMRALAKDSALRDLPVVMMSAMPPKNLPSDAKPKYFLHKPFEIDDMLAAIAKLLGR